MRTAKGGVITTISWSVTEPSVDAWTETIYTDAYHQQTTNANWYARIGFSIGRITGTRDFAVRAVCQGRKASGWQAQGPSITPRITVEGVTAAGSNRSGSRDSTNWGSLGSTQYAVVTGARSRAEVTAADNHGNAVTLASPIAAPQVFLKAGGAWYECEAVFVKEAGIWQIVEMISVKAGHAWKEA